MNFCLAGLSFRKFGTLPCRQDLSSPVSWRFSSFQLSLWPASTLRDGVGRIGPVELDSIAIFSRKDLLLHEAHRHAYIERFGLMGLLKLKCGNTFGKRANSNWRLLFVMALMPWLCKYRVSEAGNKDGDDLTMREYRTMLRNMGFADKSHGSEKPTERKMNFPWDGGWEWMCGFTALI